jgi:nucleoside-diphosphate-sugar epimerase
MSRCLVTGHKGYIGSRLYKKLKSLGHEVRGIDLVDGEDILDGLDHMVQFEPEYIFHLACIPRVAYSTEFPVHTMINNVVSTSMVLDFARKNNVKRVIYSSSSSIVGNGRGPTNPYALQKMTSEYECRIYAELYGVDTVALRYFNVYSEDQERTGPYATAVANWMHYIREGESPFITGDGYQRRDMLHVNDAVSANIFAMEYEGVICGKYDVGTGDNISLNELKDLVLKYHPNVKFDYVDKRKGDVLLTRANTQPLEELGWKASTPLETGLSDCFKQCKRNGAPAGLRISIT